MLNPTVPGRIVSGNSISNKNKLRKISADRGLSYSEKQGASRSNPISIGNPPDSEENQYHPCIVGDINDGTAVVEDNGIFAREGPGRLFCPGTLPGW